MTNKYTTSFFIEKVKSAEANRPLSDLTAAQYSALSNLTYRKLGGARPDFISAGNSVFNAKGNTPRARVLHALRTIQRKTRKFARKDS